MQDAINTLERLRALGYEPFLALLVLLVLMLGGGLCTLAVFFYWQIRTIFARRDVERIEEREDVENRLQACETEREELREDLSGVKVDIARFKACQKKGCPMRLPP